MQHQHNAAMHGDECAELAGLLGGHGGRPVADALLQADRPRPGADLTVLQLDRTQVVPLATLQLLRHAASGGANCGVLQLIDEQGSPELRLRIAPTGPSPPSLLGPLCQPLVEAGGAGHAWLNRLLDFRCHQRPGRPSLPAPLRHCLRALMTNSPSAGLSDAIVGAGGDGRARRAVAQRAALLLAKGLEASVSQLAAASQAPPCCTLRPCTAGDAAAAAYRISNINGSHAASRSFAHPPGLPLLQPPADRTRAADSAVAQSAARLVADGLKLLPSQFSGTYRNPCWPCPAAAAAAAGAAAAPAEPAGERLCCLPAAHVLGVSKCGTTDLHARLARHPHVLPSANKGPHFWDEAHPFEWYVGLYARGARRLADGAAERRRSALFLDASSNTFTWSGIGVRGARHPQRALLPHVLAWVQPQLRLLLLLREPAARYFSAYWYYHKRYGIYRAHGALSAQSFDRMARAETARFAACRAAHSLRRCARAHFDGAQQLVKGLYAAFLPDWLSAFRREQLLVSRLEDYEVRPAAHLRAALRLFGLPPPPRARWAAMLAQPRANRRAAGGGMLPSTRARLRAFFAAANAELAHLLDDERYLWADAPNASGAASGAPPPAAARARRCAEAARSTRR